MAKKTVRKVHVLSSNAEPTWDREYTQAEIHQAMSWYNNNKTEKDAAKYLGITDPSAAKRFTSLAWSLRMQSRGCKFTEKSRETINGMHAMLKEYLSHIAVPTTTEPAGDVVSIQDRVNAKTDSIIGELEGLVDDYGIRGDVAKMNAYQWMVDNEVKSIHASKIAEYFSKRADVLQKEFKEHREYYEGYDKKQFLNLFKCYAMIAADAKKLSSNAKVARKPRKKKPVSFDKLVKNLKFMPKFDDLKLQSIDPVKVIGAAQLWVYNTKTRKLGVYNAMDEAGLTVKGSAITNYSMGSSISKTLRKPEKTLKIVTEGGKISLRKVMDEVNSKPSTLNGRINKETILLRVVSN